MAPTWSRMIGLAKRYSLLPSMLTYSVLYPSANIVQQKCFREPGPIDWHEVGRFLIYGGLCHAPLVFNWLRLAARLFPKDTLGHLAAKVFLDQTCFAPVGLTCFYVGLSTLEGKSREGIYKEWKEKFPNTWATGILVWPIFQAINFKFVPGRLRTIYVGFCGFFWFTFLAYVKSTEKPWRSPVLDLVNKHANTNF